MIAEESKSAGGAESAEALVPVEALALVAPAGSAVLLLLSAAALVFALVLVLSAAVFVSVAGLLLVVAQPLRKNPSSNSDKVEGLTKRAIVGR